MLHIYVSIIEYIILYIYVCILLHKRKEGNEQWESTQIPVEHLQETRDLCIREFTASAP